MILTLITITIFRRIRVNVTQLQLKHKETIVPDRKRAKVFRFMVFLAGR